VKKIIKIVLASFAVFSLISCVDNQTSNSESSSINEQSSSIDGGTSSSESSSSSIPQDIYYHVTFLNDDGTLLYEIDVLEGNEAVYSGETPTKAEDDEFTYTFKGWDKDLSSITENVTTKAEYTAEAKINWGPIIWF